MVMVEYGTDDDVPLSDYLSVEDAARVSGYTGQYLRRMARAGRLKGRKVGHFWLIEAESLQQFVARAQSSDDKRFGPWYGDQD